MVKLWSVILLAALLLSACAQSLTSAPAAPVTPPAPPQQDLATLTGRLVDKETGAPRADTIVRLAEVYRGEDGKGGNFILNMYSSPGALTDANGYFIFENIPAVEYVASVGTGDNVFEYDVIEGLDGNPQAIMALANQVIDIGVIKTDYKP